MNNRNFNIGKYVNNVTGLQFFQLFRFGILLLISIVFTKTNLRTGEIGVYETFILIAGGVSFFWIGGFLQSLLASFNNNKQFKADEKNPVFFNVFLLFCLLSFFAAVFVLLTQDFISSLLSLQGNRIPYMKILFLYICVSGPVNMIEYIYMLKNRSKHIIYYGIITFGLQFFCVTLPVVLGYDLGYGLYGLVFINGIRFIWLLLLLYRYSIPKFSIPFLKEYLRLSAPLIISLLLGGSATYIDGFLVSSYFDEATFAVFRYGARELPFVILLANAFSNALTPSFSNRNNLRQSLESLKSGSVKLMYILFPASIIFIPVSKWLYPIVFNPDFTESAYVFNVYLLLIISRLVFPQTILIGLKRTNIIMYAAAAEIVLNISLSIVFIRYWGITGVAWATLIAFIFEKFFLSLYLKYKEKISPEQYIKVIPYVLLSLAITLAFVISLFI